MTKTSFPLVEKRLWMNIKVHPDEDGDLIFNIDSDHHGYFMGERDMRMSIPRESGISGVLKRLIIAELYSDLRPGRPITIIRTTLIIEE